jgi:3-phosphoshikimate 1-carboxyvinyltransferase
MGLMGAKVEWEPNAVTVTGPPAGQLKAIDHNCNDIPDAAMTLAVVALLADGLDPTSLQTSTYLAC